MTSPGNSTREIELIIGSGHNRVLVRSYHKQEHTMSTYTLIRNVDQTRLPNDVIGKVELGDEALDCVAGAQGLTDNDRAKLEWIGVRTVSGLGSP